MDGGPGVYLHDACAAAWHRVCWRPGCPSKPPPEQADPAKQGQPLIELGLSAWAIRGVADEYIERGYANMQATDGDTRTAELDAWLRQRLAELGVRPEHIEIECQRVMAVVWGDVQ